MLAARADADRLAIEGRRAKDRARQTERRHVTSRDITLDNVTIRDVTGEPSPSPLPSPDTPNQPHTPTRTGTTRAREAARLPEDWKPTKLGADTVAGQIVAARGRDWARKALESFRNHWRSANGPNARKRDWQATWANWVIEQDNRDGRRGGTERVGGNNGSHSGLGRTVDAAQLALQRRADRVATGH